MFFFFFTFTQTYLLKQGCDTLAESILIRGLCKNKQKQLTKQTDKQQGKADKLKGLTLVLESLVSL